MEAPATRVRLLDEGVWPLMVCPHCRTARRTVSAGGFYDWRDTKTHDFRVVVTGGGAEGARGL